MYLKEDFLKGRARHRNTELKAIAELMTRLEKNMQIFFENMYENMHKKLTKYF